MVLPVYSARSYQHSEKNPQQHKNNKLVHPAKKEQQIFLKWRLNEVFRSSRYTPSKTALLYPKGENNPIKTLIQNIPNSRVSLEPN